MIAGEKTFIILTTSKLSACVLTEVHVSDIWGGEILSVTGGPTRP